MRPPGRRTGLRNHFGVPPFAVRGPHEILTIVRTPGTEVTVRQVDRARTTALLLGITAAVIGLLAFAASQIEYSFPNSGSY